MISIKQEFLTLSMLLLQRLGVFLTKSTKEGGNETFNGSKGWFARFKQCLQIPYIKVSGEAASADIEATREFTIKFKKIIENNDFPPDLVFNVNETGLY